jgi:hypothetical protein
VIVIVNPAPPGACVGDTEAIVGTGLFIANGSEFETPVAGAGSTTDTFIVAPVAMSVAGICTTTCPAVIDVGTKPVIEPKFTVAPGRKPLPLIVNANDDPPAVAVVGEIEVTASTVLSIVNGSALDIPPPGAGLVTVTLMLVTVAISGAGIVTTICVVAREVGVSEPNDPNVTVAPVTKFVPVIVSGNAAPPAVALDWERLAIVGSGLFTVNVWDPLVPPPGAGFVTVTLTGPAVAAPLAGTGTVNVVPPLPTVPPVI